MSERMYMGNLELTVRMSGSSTGWAVSTDRDVLGFGDSPVEAAAACWLAVLRAAREAKS